MQKNNPSLNIKFAWVGSSKTAKRIEKPDWYDGTPYYQINEDGVRTSLGARSYIKSLNDPGYAFFDLKEIVSSKERLEKEPMELLESDLRENAKKVVGFLLGN